MSNSMNKPELEILSHKPASAPREGKEKTTLDIEPKTKVENKESVGQPQQPICKICNGTGHYTSEKEYEADCMVCRPPSCSEQPNQQIMLVKKWVSLRGLRCMNCKRNMNNA